MSQKNPQDQSGAGQQSETQQEGQKLGGGGQRREASQETGPSGIPTTPLPGDQKVGRTTRSGEGILIGDQTAQQSGAEGGVVVSENPDDANAAGEPTHATDANIESPGAGARNTGSTSGGGPTSGSTKG